MKTIMCKRTRITKGHQWSNSVQFSHSVTSDALWPHGLQHARPPCPSPTPGVYSKSCPWIGNAIQPFHPLLFPSPPTFNLSQHQGLFKWVSSSHQVAKILELQLQHQSFQWIFRTDFLQDGLVGSPCSSRSNSWWCQRITYSFSTKMWPKCRRLRSKLLFSGQVMSGCFVTPWTVAL